MTTRETFGPGLTWLAARSDAPERVAEGAGVRDLRRVPWAQGLAAAYARSGEEPSCLVTPSIDGWVLVASVRLPHLRGDEGELQSLLERTSAWARGAEVQAFASLPMADYQAWARAAEGRLARSFYWFGAEDHAREAGDRTPEEAGLGLPAADPSKTTLESVLAVAAGWSLDPTTIAARGLAPAEVWVGSLPDPEAERQARREQVRDQASRDVEEAMAALVESDLASVAPPAETRPEERAQKLEGMAAHMAALGYQVTWAADRTRFDAAPPDGSPLPPMSFGLDDV